MSARLDTVAALIGDTTPCERTALGGGDLSTLWRLRFASGRDVVVKEGGEAEKEAAMLRAISATGVHVPPVLAVGNGLLVLGYVPSHGLNDAGWVSLGQTMRQLHDAPQPARYGWMCDYAFGTVPVVNRWATDWRDFWRDSRLKPCLSFLPRVLAARIAHLMRDLDRFLPASPRPALLHGDLWTGNVLTTDRAPAGGRSEGGSPSSTQVVLIDPACYIGDAGADFGILTLFSTPPHAFWEAYGALPEGFAQSIGVYRLWPALVHYRLFGDGYLGMVDACLDALEL
ncbi:fructosamine kinase family protein [Asaia lannensis]|uniref:fructosamine kinase family protein n=1 Tax=Asaia lannensis TaxID=415421 RepID=UPI001C99B4FC